MKRILFLDDNKELCTLMLSVFETLGSSDVVCLNSYAEVKDLAPHKLNVDYAFLDVNLGNNVPSGIDVFNYLLEQNFKGKVIFFTGHARSYPTLQKLLEYPNVSILEKPADINQIDAIINS